MTDSDSVMPSAPLHRLVHFLCRLAPGVGLFGLLGLATVLIFHDARAFFLLSTLFIVFNLYITGHVGWFSLRGYRQWRAAEQRDIVKDFRRERKALLRDGTVHPGDLLEWEDVRHYVVIPNYREHASILSETLDSLARSSHDLTRKYVIVVLAMEDREQGAEQKAMDLIAKHSHQFLDMMYSLHPKDLPGELPGKSSNERWAVEQVNQDVRRRGWDPNRVCLTISDADSNLNPKHLPFVHAAFCNDIERDIKIWQGPIFCYRNLDTVPAPTRMLAQAVSLHEIACLADKNDLHIPFSTYSVSLNFANLAQFDPTVIPEDWHLFLSGYFRSGGRARVEAVPYPVTCYAVESNTWWESVKERYIQAKRHSWAVSEITYFLRQMADYYLFKRHPNIRRPSLGRTFKVLRKIVSIHLIAGAATYFLFVPGLVIFLYMVHPWLNSQPESVLLVTQWSALYRYLNIITVVPLLMSGYAHFKISTDMLGRERASLPKQIIWAVQFAVFGIIVNLWFAMIPTILACARLFMTENFTYIVAAKPELSDRKSDSHLDSIEGEALTPAEIV